MSILDALVLGFIQGITEFLPVSSSGHLVIARELLDIGQISILFDILLHMATLVAVLAVFRQRVYRILISFGALFSQKTRLVYRQEHRLILIILVATACTALVGGFVSSLDVEQNPKLTATLFIVTGVILASTRFIRPRTKSTHITFFQGVVTGVCQGIGVFPGISRSGITVTAALHSGVQRENAGEFSFLIAIPAILGALILKLKDAGDLFSSVSAVSLTVGIVVALVSGLFSLLLFLRLIKKGNLYLFSFYLIPLGIVLLIFL